MSEHPNVELLKSGFAAFASGDMATLDELFADDAVWHGGGRHRFSGDFEGKAAIFGMFAELVSYEDSFQQDIHAAFADAEHGVALVKGSARRGDKALDGNNVFVFHIADSRVTEVWVTAVDPYAVDEYWA
ncbi:MAG: nuclear transport factor 2 family protein [Acidimicrobiia bacterium]